jgi:hypothetical protein
MVSVSLASVVLPASQVHAEDVKVLLENAKVRVLEVTFPPGDSSKLMQRPYRIVRALTDGTLERTSADGTKEVVEWKAGDVKDYGPDTYSAKNVGSDPFSLYVVIPK